LNIHQFTKFAKELNKALIETHFPPEIKVSLTDVGAISCDVSIESSKFGTGPIPELYAILVYLP
jgi:hypothetical protein